MIHDNNIHDHVVVGVMKFVLITAISKIARHSRYILELHLRKLSIIVMKGMNANVVHIKMKVYTYKSYSPKI